MEYETSHYLRSHPHRRRAATVADRPALPRRLHLTPLPDPPRQRGRSGSRPHRPQPRLYGPLGPRRRPCLRPRGAGLLAGEVLAAPQRPAPAGHRLRGAAAAPAAPEPARLRQAPRHLDVGPARSGLLREGLDAPSAQHRDPPPGHPPPGGFLAAGQALDPQPRPRLRAKKKARDRLIRLAARHPDWVLGYQDECWWSRLAQPDLHAWAEEEPLR